MDEKPSSRKRILWAAGEIFSEAGFRQATIRQISRRAGVNVASINYYFQSKDNLYLETLRYWKDIAFEKYPRELGTSPSDTPEVRLKGFIRSLVYRILDSGVESRFGRLMVREFTDPTAALDVIIEETTKPMFTQIGSIIGKIIGKDPMSDTVLYCTSSIIGQCLYFLYARPVYRRLIGEQKVRSLALDDIADHICRFSLAALSEIRKDEQGA
jgi:TetR/AcrR family transcriptional regulator, regulator of cefoperazone and chloramphenicol sensitivity